MVRQEKAMLELVDFRSAVPTPETKFPISERKRWGPRREKPGRRSDHNVTESYLTSNLYMDLEPGFKGEVQRYDTGRFRAASDQQNCLQQHK